MLEYPEIINLDKFIFKVETEKNEVMYNTKIIKKEGYLTIENVLNDSFDSYDNMVLDILEVTFGFDEGSYWVTCSIYFYPIATIANTPIFYQSGG